jgi:hypothetical protein
MAINANPEPKDLSLDVTIEANRFARYLFYLQDLFASPKAGNKEPAEVTVELNEDRTRYLVRFYCRYALSSYFGLDYTEFIDRILKKRTYVQAMVISAGVTSRWTHCAEFIIGIPCQEYYRGYLTTVLFGEGNPLALATNEPDYENYFWRYTRETLLEWSLENDQKSREVQEKYLQQCALDNKFRTLKDQLISIAN